MNVDTPIFCYYFLITFFQDDIFNDIDLIYIKHSSEISRGLGG